MTAKLTHSGKEIANNYVPSWSFNHGSSDPFGYKSAWADL